MTFQSTLPRRERPRRRVLCIGRLAISIHAPAKGATGAQCFVSAAAEFQSTLPRRERPAAARDYRAWVEISIHAPAKGATHRGPRRQIRRADFNPRSREGSDVRCSVFTSWHLHFNPRSREGSDTAATCAAVLAAISIHAPAKGATIPYVVCQWRLRFQYTLPRRERLGLPSRNRRIRLFQSTLPRRERRAQLLGKLHQLRFQSTLPRRERPVRLHQCVQRWHFNPRSREGSDTLT